VQYQPAAGEFGGVDDGVHHGGPERQAPTSRFTLKSLSCGI
jgi:hypothetical protein